VPAAYDDALCIRTWDWSETSLTVSLLCRERGVVRALAKGAKRPKAPYSGGIELLSRGQAGLIIKPAADLALLTEWDLRETFPVLRADLHAHRTGLYIADVLHHLVRDHDPHPALFDLTVTELRRLPRNSDGRDRRAAARFLWGALGESGFRPVLTLPADADHGPRAAASGCYLFSPERGGVIGFSLAAERSTARSRRSVSHADRPQSVLRVRASTIALLERLSGGDDLSSCDVEAAARASRLLAEYLYHVLGVRPPSHALLFESAASR
jgi:DNA repair protein RecO (recombination protein O)